MKFLLTILLLSGCLKPTPQPKRIESIKVLSVPYEFGGFFRAGYKGDTTFWMSWNKWIKPDSTYLIDKWLFRVSPGRYNNSTPPPADIDYVELRDGSGRLIATWLFNMRMSRPVKDRLEVKWVNK